MATFLLDLFNSIFTPGTTPTLVVATNASFACLQLVLGILLFATYSIHFLILSVLCGGLWWAINWFVGELAAAKQKEEEADRLRNLKRGKERQVSPVEGSETEGEPVSKAAAPAIKEVHIEPPPAPAAETIRKRRSLPGEMSTEDEWEQVEEEGSKAR